MEEADGSPGSADGACDESGVAQDFRGKAVGEARRGGDERAVGRDGEDEEDEGEGSGEAGEGAEPVGEVGARAGGVGGVQSCTGEGSDEGMGGGA